MPLWGVDRSDCQRALMARGERQLYPSTSFVDANRVHLRVERREKEKQKTCAGGGGKKRKIAPRPPVPRRVTSVERSTAALTEDEADCRARRVLQLRHPARARRRSLPLFTPRARSRPSRPSRPNNQSPREGRNGKCRDKQYEYDDTSTSTSYSVSPCDRRFLSLLVIKKEALQAAVAF